MRRMFPNLMVLLALIVSAVLGACASPTATPIPPLEPSDRTAVPPTPTVAPTVEPTPVIAPRLLRTEPEPGEALVQRAPIVLVFDQPMDKTSTEGAFALQPLVDGKLTWDDARTLRFTPDADWPPDSSYVLTLSEEALNVQGLPLMAPVSARLDTVGFLEVARVQPAAASKDVAVDTIIRVAFNRPVVPLSVEELQPSVLDPLRMTPAVPGKGRWVNTALYEFGTLRVRPRPAHAGRRALPGEHRSCPERCPRCAAGGPLCLELYHGAASCGGSGATTRCASCGAGTRGQGDL